MRLPLLSLFERRDFVPMDSALARLWGGANIQTSAGVGVSEDSALNIAAFWRGVQLISGQIAAMPLHLYKAGKDGAQTRFTNSKLYKLLHDNPNPEMTAFSFRESLQAHLLTWGNAFAEIERNNIGQPIALWPITPDRVVFYRDMEDKRLKYRVAPSGRVIEAPDMLHIPGLGFDGLIGYSVIGRARQSLGLMVASERYGSTFFGNGASFGGVLESQDDMDADQRKELRKEITDFHQGPDRAHRFLILWNGLKYSKMAMAPEEAQFLQTRRHQVVEIARWLGAPPNKLYESEGRTPPATSIEALGIEYYTDTMLMWFEKWEQELNRKLIPALEQNYQYFEFDFAGLMRADTGSRYTAYSTGKQGGWLSSDDIRGFENMAPLPNGAGDFYLAPLNMIPADKFRDYIEKKVNAKTALPSAPTPTAGSGKSTQDPQEAVDQAIKAARAAEIAAAEARGRAEALAAEVAEMRARAVVPAEQFAALQRDLAAQIAVAEASTLLAENMRKSAEQAQLAAAVDREAKAEQERRAVAAEASAEAANTLRLAAEIERDQAREASGYATSQAAAAQTALEARTAELTEARATVDASVAELQRLTSAQAAGAVALEQVRGELQAAIDAAATGSASSTATIEQLRADLAVREARQEATAADLAAALVTTTNLQEQIAIAEQRATDAAAAVVEADGRRADIEVQLAMAEQAARDAQAAAESAEAQRREATAAREEALSASAAAEQARAAADTARVEAERRQAEAEAGTETARRSVESVRAEADMTRSRDRARIGAVLAAHRKLFVDVMRRMIERETERMHRAQATPEKLRSWVDSFYAGHEELCVNALLPAVTVHVAWSGRPDDPEVLTRALVAAHVAESKRQLAAVLDGDAEALAGSVYALTQRWSRERVETIADRILQDEVDRHVRGDR